jgi:UDP-N-acetylglucosamine 2-epimerase (non-hydrolysing)
VHPRTRKRLDEFGLADRVAKNQALMLIEPVGYLDFLALQDHAAVVLTDSGGIQEETTALGVPCITIRENTERPSTVEVGTNELIGLDVNKIIDLSHKAMKGEWKKSGVPELWDGKASERILAILKRTIV